ncbi:MAG: PD40 domain-containing protein [Acidobacteria bacterium]|nr:PD40 domain-containing protein [Acidobacteriota bacterium]
MSLNKSRLTVRLVLAAVVLGTFAVFGLALSGNIASFESLFAAAARAQGSSPAARPAPPKSDPETDKPAPDRPQNLGGTDGKIIFGTGAPTNALEYGNGRISAIDPVPGSTAEVLSATKDLEPQWSPDGKKIVFISTRDGSDPDWEPEELTNREIYIMNADGTDQRRLTYNAVPEAQPIFSPDGTKILYVRGIDINNPTNSAVYSMNLDGSGETLLFDEGCLPIIFNGDQKKNPKSGGAQNYYPGIIGIDTPNYSPDQSNIIFGYFNEAYRFDAQTGTCSLLAYGDAPTEPRYSPDGTKILINSAGFRVLNASGATIETYNPPNYVSGASWSPDGNRVAYFGSDPGSGIWTMDLNTQTVEQVYATTSDVLFAGMAWKIPATAVPDVSLSLSPRYSVAGGETVQGVVHVNPAAYPAGGTFALGQAGLVGVISLPQTSVTVPAGGTSAVFDIETIPYPATSNIYRSADVVITNQPTPARTTVSVRPQRPDLRVTNITTPATINLGAAFNASWTVENIGPAGTINGFTDRVYFSTDNQLDAGDTLLSTLSNAALGAGQQRVNTRSITLDHNLRPANQQNYLIVYTNSSSAVDEDGRYENNLSVQPIQIVTPDLTIENLTAPAQIEAGVNFNVSFTIRSAGAPTGTSFTTRLYMSFDETLENADDVLLSTFTDTAATAGQTISKTATNRVIPTTPVRPDSQGKIYVKVDANDVIHEGPAGETNNITSQNVPFFYHVPDLQVSSVTAPAEVDSQTAFSLQWTDLNAGTRNAGTFSDRVYFSTDDQVGGDTLLGTFSLTGGIAASVSANRTQNITIPTTAVSQTGDYYVYVQTDATSVIDEGANETNNIRFQPLRVRRLAPDAVIENLTVPAEIEAGVNYTFSYNVRNAGAATTAVAFENRLYFSPDQTIGNADDILLNSYTQTAMAAGQTVTKTFSNVKIPTVPVLPDSQAIVYVKADFNNAINEGTVGEANNTASAGVPFFYRVPDLQVASTGAPAEVDSDTAFAMQWTTVNAGNRGAAVFADKVYFSLDNQVGSDVEIGSFNLTGGLSAGESANRIQNVTIPTNVLSQTGNYYVYVKADGGDGIDEGVNENNNIRFQPVRVRRLLRPDLTITNITAPAAAFFDQTIQVQWTVTNSGQGPTNAAQWSDKVFLSTGQSTSSTAHVATANSISALNPGESYTTSATFKVPRGYNGTYLFTIKTDVSGALNEENAANNILTRPIQINVPPLPDLIVESVQVPVAEAFAGQELAVGYTIRNQGTDSAYSWRDRVYLSRDTTLNTGQDKLIFTTDGYDSGTLDANQSRTMLTRNHIAGTANPVQYTTMRLPADVSGLWYVFIVTDYADDVYEFTNENNNTNYDSVQPGAPLNILITPPDLVVPNQIAAPAAGSGGQNIPVDFTVKNQGAFNASANLFHAVYLSTDQTFDAEDDTLLGSIRDEDFFAPAAEHPLTMNVRLPDCLADGTYYLFAVADYNNRQNEFDPNYDAEANNAGPPKPIQLTTPPVDLQISNVQISPPITTAGQPANLTWTVTNAGTAATRTNWTDKIILNSVAGFAPVTLNVYQRIGSLAPGASYTNTATINLPSYLQGDYFIAFTTDSENTVAECGASENNNSFRTPDFAVTGVLPDLVVDSVTVPTAAVVGASFDVQYVVRNNAQAMSAPPGGWRDAIYLSTNATLNNTDRRIGETINAFPLGAGQTYQKQVSVTPQNVAAGNYYILVVADDDRDVYEGYSGTAPEENNLRASIPISLTSPDVDLTAAVNSVSTPTYAGSYVNVSWTVANNGSTPTQGDVWYDHAILSRDAIYDSSDVNLGGRRHSGALGAGQNYQSTSSFLLPNGLTGDYNIFIVTDRSGYIVENLENNNISPPYAVNLELPPPADLNITNVSPPPAVNLGETASFSWTVQNTGANAVSGRWRDTVYLSRDVFWDSGDVLIGQRDFDSGTTAVPPNGTYTATASFKISTVEEGTYYVIVRTDAQNRIRETNEANNVSAAAAITTVAINVLPLDTPVSTTLENGAEKFYKFTTDPFESIIYTLTTDTPSRSNELLTNFGTIAGRADYDYQGDRPNEGNQRTFIPETRDGSYYSLVRTDLIPTSFAGSFDKTAPPSGAGKNLGTPVPPQNITLKAQVLPFSIARISPAEAGNEGFATLTIEGAKFQPGASVRLVSAANVEIAPLKTDVLAGRILALFQLRDAAAGLYDVAVTNPDNQMTTLADGFRIVAGGGGSTRLNINGPGTTRGGRTRYTFSVTNDGLNDMLLVPMVIKMPAAWSYEIDRGNYRPDLIYDFLPSGYDVSQLPPSVIEQGGTRLIMLFTPILRSKRTVSVNVDMVLPATVFSNEVSFFTLPPLADWQNLASRTQTGTLPRGLFKNTALENADLNLQNCLLEVLRKFIFIVLSDLLPGDCVGAAWGGLATMIDTAFGAYAKGSGYSEWDGVGDLGGLLFSTLGNLAEHCLDEVVPWFKTVDAILKWGKLLLDLAECYRQYRDDPSSYLNKGIHRPYSFDPNEKIGPDGFGAEKFIPVNQPLLYRINFENLASASAPAQQIRITDVLPPTLDPRTVRLKEIGFKQNRYVVPDNQAFYQTRVQLGEDLNNLKADISAGLDVLNGQIFWTVTAIDPATGDRPDDPLVGILPPNNENSDGEGFVTFTVEAKPGFPNRTAVGNFATIYFDENEPIVTNTTSNLLDSVIPASAVAPLPATSDSPVIDLNWSGTDDADGSGFSGYTIFYSEDGGNYRPLVAGTTATGIQFVGNWGKSYRFYSVASDNAGNVEAPPVTPDAVVTILGGDTEGDLAPRPNGSDGQVSVADVTQARRFAAGLDTNFLYNEFQRTDAAPLAENGDGAISTADVVQIRRFAAGLDQKTDAAGPNEPAGFNPKRIGGRSSALLPRELRPVRIGRVGNKLILGVELEAQGDEVGVGFTLNFDPAVLGNPANASPGSGAGGAALTVNDSQAAAGRLGVIVDRAPNDPFAAGVRQILSVEFDILMPNQPASAIGFGSSPVLSEIVDGGANSLTAVFSNRSISLVTPTAAGVTVAGRVVSAAGGPPVRAKVVIADSRGNSRTAVANSFGSFRFTDVPSGETYVVTVVSKGGRFTPRVIGVTDSITDLVLNEDP